MKSIIVGLGLSLLIPLHAHADPDYVTEDWTVLDSELSFTGTGVFTDTEGHFGSAGRRLQVSDIRAELDSGAANLAQIDRWNDGWVDNRLKINYTLHYTVTDWTTQELVAHESASFLYDSHGNGLGGGGQAYGDIGLFQQIGAGSRYGFHILTTDNPDGSKTLNYDDWLGGSVLLSYKPEFRQTPGGGGVIASISGSVHIAPVPEPEQYALLATGLLGLALARRRMSRRTV